MTSGAENGIHIKLKYFHPNLYDIAIHSVR